MFINKRGLPRPLALEWRTRRGVGRGEGRVVAIKFSRDSRSREKLIIKEFPTKLYFLSLDIAFFSI